MDVDEHKKYNILENILQKVNQKYVALSAAETKRNNKILQQIVDPIIQELRSKNVLFDNMYQKKFYGGSFYDGLKIGNPSEYDLDCLLCLPKLIKPTVEVSDKPGYVHLVLKDLKALENQANESPKFVGLNKLLGDNSNCLSTKNVKAWMEGLMSSVVSGTVTTEVKIDETTTCDVKYKVSKSGPAYTIKMECEESSRCFNLDVDLVPCFTFFDDQWPSKGYRKNPTKARNTFFVVPKSPNEDSPLHWRLSFQEQERELIISYSVLKPTIRLIKKMRDRYMHKVASYYIKTIFLWELETIDKNLWNKSLTSVFAMMLKRYSEYIEKKSIPYYWNKQNNLIADLSDVTAAGIANTLKNMVVHIDRICNTKSDLYGILKYFLTSDEVDVETFKQEVPLNKKLLKQIGARSPEASTILVISQPASASTSRASSIEEDGKGLVSEASAKQRKTDNKLEGLLLGLMSEQKKMRKLLETAIIKIERCESEVKQLKCEIDKKWTVDDVQRKNVYDMLTNIDKKVTKMSKGDDLPSVDDILGLTQKFDLSHLQ